MGFLQSVVLRLRNLFAFHPPLYPLKTSDSRDPLTRETMQGKRGKKEEQWRKKEDLWEKRGRKGGPLVRWFDFCERRGRKSFATFFPFPRLKASLCPWLARSSALRSLLGNRCAHTHKEGGGGGPKIVQFCVSK